MHILIGIIGIIFLHSDRKISAGDVGIFGYQLVFAFILLKTTAGITVIGGISEGLTTYYKSCRRG